MMKRPAAHSGRHAPTRSLAPLLCAAILILFFSGCQNRDIKPVDNVSPTAGEESAETQADAGNGGASEGEEAGKTPKTSSDTPAGEPGTQSNEIEAKLQGLSGYLSVVSEVLNARPEDDTPELILSNATQWLSDLKIQVDALITASETSDKSDEIKPELDRLLERLGDIKHAVMTTPSTVEQLQGWITELKGITTNLSETYGTAPPVPPDNNEESDAVSKRLDELSASVEGIAQNLRNLSLRVNANSKPSVSIGIWGVLFFAVSALNLLFSIYLFLAIRGTIRELASGNHYATEQNRQGKGNPIYDVKAVVVQLLDKVDRLSEKVDNLSEYPNADMFAQRPDETDTSPMTLNEAKNPSPVKQYFQVTKTVSDTVYLQAKPNNTGDIWAWASAGDDNPQAYDIFPETTQTQDNGKSGFIPKNRLLSSGVRDCFNLPKSLPAGRDIYVTVKKPARIKLEGNQYVLKKDSDLGELSVTGGS